LFPHFRYQLWQIENQLPPQEYKQILPGDASKLLPGSEALGVYLAGQVPNIAMTVGVATHRIEVTGLSSVETTRRASKGVQIEMLIHPDDTGKDTSPPSAIVEKLNDPNIQLAVVANTAAFLSSAQTSNPDVTVLGTDEYSDTETAKAIKEACEKGQCIIIEIEKEVDVGFWTAGAIAGVAVGATIGACCVCAGIAGAIYLVFFNKKTPPAPMSSNLATSQIGNVANAAGDAGTVGLACFPPFDRSPPNFGPAFDYSCVLANKCSGGRERGKAARVYSLPAIVLRRLRRSGTCLLGQETRTCLRASLPIKHHQKLPLLLPRTGFRKPIIRMCVIAM
jgi:hypothetical protein